MKRSLIIFFSLFCATASAQTPGVDAGAPVSIIETSPYRGFTNAIVLQNDYLRAVILPSIGRLMEIRLLDSENPLRSAAILDKGRSSDTNTWPNDGGNWVWPAGQSGWPDAFGRGHPPPVFDSPASEWTASAWKRADGAQFCRLQVSVGEPMHVRVTREFLLSKKSARLEISQRIDRVLESKLPVTIRTVTQLTRADEVVLPLDAGTDLIAADKKPVPPGCVVTCSNAAVINTRDVVETKAGSASPRNWIAGRKGNLVLILTVRPDNAAGAYPDKGCRVEMFTNKGLGYTELETRSEERALAPGETAANTITLAIYRAPEPLSGCEFAKWTMQLIGEIPFPRSDDLVPAAP